MAPVLFNLYTFLVVESENGGGWGSWSYCQVQV